MIWLANYRRASPLSENTIFEFGFVFVAISGAVAGWTDEMGPMELASSLRDDEVWRRKVITWAIEYL